MKSTEEKLLCAIHIAYKYGTDQIGKRIEPKDTIIFWCGYKIDMVPKQFINSIYAAYRLGRDCRLSGRS